MLKLAILIISAGIIVSFVALLGLSTGLSEGLLVVLAIGLAVGGTGILLARAASSPAATQRRLRPS
jgi:hypothetical protein